MRSITTTLVAVAALAIPAGPLAAKDASEAVGIRLVVPEACNVSAEQFSISEDGTVTGSVQEYCNTSTAFQIVASYRPLLGTERARLRYGSGETELDSSGMAFVANRFGQRLDRVAVSIEAQELVQPLALAFSVMAI